METANVPRSNVPGLHWPAVPGAADAAILGISFQLDQSQWWTAEGLAARQEIQLGELIRHARGTVPFYRDRLPDATDLPPAVWQDIPLLERADLQDDPLRLRSTALAKSHTPVSQVSTSGSSGRAVTVLTTQVTGLMNAAVGLRYHRWHARAFDATVASIQVVSGAHADTAATRQASNWVPGHDGGEIYYSGVDRTVREQAAWLEEIDPDYLFTYPSNLDALLDYCETAGLKFPKLRHVATLGEALDPALRRRLDELWGVPLIDAYSAAEIGLLALQCPAGDHYHVQSERARLELLREDGTPCKPGETGEIVVTDCTISRCPSSATDWATSPNRARHVPVDAACRFSSVSPGGSEIC